MTQEEIDKIIAGHKEWILSDHQLGKQADFGMEKLRDADLHGAEELGEIQANMDGDEARA